MSYGLGEVVREIAGRRGRQATEKVDLAPGCAFGAVVDERLKDLTAKADEIRGRINALIFTVLGAIVVELLLKLYR